MVIVYDWGSYPNIATYNVGNGCKLKVESLNHQVLKNLKCIHLGKKVCVHVLTNLFFRTLFPLIKGAARGVV